MPGPLDLSGRRFGKLLVISRAEGKTRGGFWLCRCDCGQEEILPAWRLPYIPSIAENRRDTLEACRKCTYTVPCQQCGKPFLSEKRARYCSTYCKKKSKRVADLKHYHAVRKIEDPDINRKQRRKMLEKISSDPEARKAWKQREARYSQAKKERLNSNPELRERANQLARVRYTAKAEETQAKKRAALEKRLAEMSPEQREAWMNNRRQKNTAWRHIHMEALRNAQPEKYRQYLDQFNAYKRQVWRRKRALEELSIIAVELEKRSKK